MPAQPLVTCKSWSHEPAAFAHSSLKFPRDGQLGRASESPGMDSSQDHGAALHGSSSCQVRCCTAQRPQCALLSAADHPRRTGVERSTSSTSSFIASTGTAAACRRPPAQLRRRADATADHTGPVAVQADLVVPPVSFVGPCVCGYRAFFFHFIDEYDHFAKAGLRVGTAATTQHPRS